MHALNPPVGVLLDTIGAAKIPRSFERGEGARLWDAEDRVYWDFYGGHAVTLLGQAHPRWVAALHSQASTFSFFTNLADCGVRTRATQALCAFTGMPVAWFINSGAEANEAALKIARKSTGRAVMIAMEHGFHGRTMGCAGVTWGGRDQHQPPHGETRFVPFGDLKALEAALDERVAGVITEPVQGIAGIVEPPAGWLKAVERMVHANGSVLVVDEIQSGIGRAGWPLLARREGVEPDLVTVGKGVGGGFPVAAVLMTEAMARTTKPGEHGTTFGGGPLACAVVEATLDIILSEKLVERSRTIGERLKHLLQVSGVTQVRGSGAWVGAVLDRPAKPVAAQLLDRGFIVGTSHDPMVLRLSPPAVIPFEALEAFATTLADILSTRTEVHP